MDSTTLYVGDLPEATTAADLEAFFIGFQIQPVLHKNNKNEIYAIIQVENSVIAHAIIDKFNYTEFKGKEIRICYFVPKLKKEIEGNLYFKAPKEMKMRQIYTILHSFGEIINLKLSQLPNGGSRGYGYVQFSKKDEAEKALAGEEQLKNTGVSVSLFVPSIQRLSNNLYVNSLPPEINTNEALQNLFLPFGKITSSALKESKLVKNGQIMKSGFFGFVNFENIEDATKAKEALNGKKFGEHTLLVSKYMSKALRANERMRKDMELKKKIVHLRNVNENATDEQLKSIFNPFGNIVNITRDPRTLAVAYAHFNTVDEASSFIGNLNKQKEANTLPFTQLGYSLLQSKSERRQFKIKQIKMSNDQFYGRYPPAMQMMPPRNMYPPQQQRAKRPEGKKRPYNPSMQMQMMGQRMPPHSLMPQMMAGQPMMPQQAIMAPQMMAPQQMPMMQPGMVPQQQMMAMYMMTAPNQGARPMGPQQPPGIQGMPPHPMHQMPPNHLPQMETKESVGEKIYGYMMGHGFNQEKCSKITGMLLELDQNTLAQCFQNENALLKYIKDANALLDHPKESNQ